MNIAQRSTTTMSSKTRSHLVLACCVLAGLAGASRYSDLKLTSTTSSYSAGESALGFAPGVCWCGPNTDCWYSHDITKHCACKPGYEGTPPQCRPAPDLWRLCFESNPCGLHAECEVENGTRSCPHCVHPAAVGSPPLCVPPDECNVVEKACGPNAECTGPFNARECSCAFGFVGEPPNCTAGPALLALCDPYPCGAYSDCRVQDGRPVCECARGYEGTPPRCEPSGEMWRVCFKDKPCGRYSKCEMVDRVAVCSPCEPGYSGETPYCYKSVIA